MAREGSQVVRSSGEATAGHDGMDVRVVLELPAPGMQDPGEPREVCPDEALVVWRAV